MIDNIDNIPRKIAELSSGPFLAKVVNHLDPSYMGTLEVEVLRPVGNDEKADGQLYQVKMMSPFWGQTSVEHIGEQNDYNNTQKSYGMWFVPPDPGTTVVVIFIEGDPKKGYWIGCVPDEAVNFMVPGIAATEYAIDGKSGERYPVAEYNKKATDVVADATKIKKPKHPFTEVLQTQGLLKDDIRGITTSSARREVPSAVFGISTPGPIDKKPNAKRGKIGTKDYPIDNAYVSRLGGSSIVMDDGDDNYLRKGPPSTKPPVYANVSQGETGGDPTIPHNELIRIRTRTGHQILLHNSEDLIYIANARGTAWVELTSNGKIDIYAADSISMHTAGDFNITADKNINLTAKENINLNAKNVLQTASSNVEIKAGADGKLTAANVHINGSSAANMQGGVTNLKSGGNLNLTASADLNLKAEAKWMQSGSSYWTKPSGGGGSSEVSQVASGAATSASAIVAPRVPMHEPWEGHENLHGGKLVYTTTIDPFRKEKPAEKGK